MQYVLFKVSVAEICKMANYYVGILDGRFDVGYSLATCHRKMILGSGVIASIVF